MFINPVDGDIVFFSEQPFVFAVRINVSTEQQQHIKSAVVKADRAVCLQVF